MDSAHAVLEKRPLSFDRPCARVNGGRISDCVDDCDHEFRVEASIVGRHAVSSGERLCRRIEPL